MNTGAQTLFKLCFFLDICPGVVLLDHMVALFLVFFFKELNNAFCNNMDGPRDYYTK